MATLEEMKAQRKSQASYGKKYGDRTIADKKYEAHRPKTNRTKEFIGWDGEGVDDKYVLLMNSKGDKITSLNGLNTDECLLFLCSIKERWPDAINVVYGGSYDANMILKDLPFKHLKLLQKNHHVFYKYFRIEYIPRKFFRVSQYDHMKYGDKRKRKPKYTVTLWDVIGFFQGSFLKSLEEYFGKNDTGVSNLHIEEIMEGKKRRNEFSENELHNFIIPYCKYECDALVALMNKLREHMLEADIHIIRWDGAGAAAAAVLKQYGVKKHYQKLPRHIEEICQVAYGGGRVEMFKYGHHDAKFSDSGYWYHLHPNSLKEGIDKLPLNFFEGLVEHYDIIGAYPSVMPVLPSLVGGKWVHNTTNYGNVTGVSFLEFDDFTLYRVYWDFREFADFSGGIYPFFYRQPWGQPRIFYSETGYTWVAGPELKAAYKWANKFQGELHVLESWQFVPATDEKPFAFVEELYKLRMKFKAEGNGAQLALKLAINALYGKMAQTVGYKNESEDEEMKLPPFYNLFYALLITSFTRAKLFDAMMQAPESIIAVATDGIWSLKPLKLDIAQKGDEKLGQWEHEQLLSFTSIQAGVYFSTKSDGTDMYHYRGFNQGTLNKEDIIRQWANLGYYYEANTRRFATLGTCVSSKDGGGKMWDQWRKFVESKRLLEIVPMHNQKREVLYPSAEAARMLMPTYATPIMRFEDEIKNDTPVSISSSMMSRKHPLPWENIMLTEAQELRRQQEEEIWEIIEADIESGVEIDLEKQRQGEF